MLILNCTKAAADFFNSTKKGKKTSVLEPVPKQTIAELNDHRQWQWLVHAIKVKGKNVLVAMDPQTRFSITLSALKKGDDSSFMNNFDNHLTVHAHEMMSAINADCQAINGSLERYRHQHGRSAFYLRGDRSVQAHINDVVWHFRRWVDDYGDVPTEVDLIGFDVFVNQLLRKRQSEKDYFTPQHEFLHGWLKHYGEYSTVQADRCIESVKKNERADFQARHPDLVPPTELTHTQLTSELHIDLSNNVVALDDYRKK